MPFPQSTTDADADADVYVYGADGHVQELEYDLNAHSSVKPSLFALRTSTSLSDPPSAKTPPGPAFQAFFSKYARRSHARGGNSRSDSVDTTVTATSTSTEQDIELASLADRARPFVSAHTHARFDSSTSVSTVSSAATSVSSGSWSSPLTSPTSQRPSFSGVIPAADTDSEATGGANSDVSPFTSMSPRLGHARYEHRIHLPVRGQHAGEDEDYDSERADANVDAQRLVKSDLPMTCQHRLDSARSSPLETDSLLRTGVPLGALPLPATSTDLRHKVRMSFTLWETGVHVLGVAVMAILIVLSFWLTLANIVM
ncbi:hypothetical protein DFH11DRAFT_1728789 [Phellopilus nigrolimitatus]|nr:hypothetical protein DFH11DRAFT_1728789 [Phellopilus nigrolimitatus]